VTQEIAIGAVGRKAEDFPPGALGGGVSAEAEMEFVIPYRPRMLIETKGYLELIWHLTRKPISA
jgi:hypothetical protein